MKKIEFSEKFNRKYKKLAKKNPAIIMLFNSAMRLMMGDVFAASLGIHKLSGELQGQWAFSLTYKLRVIFEWKSDTIRFVNIGTHDEVY
jgi:mRNA interferase YafQ